MSIFVVVLSVLVGLGVGRLGFGLFFTDADDFCDCLRFSLTPNLFSLFRGEYLEDVAKSMKLGLFMALVIGSGALTFTGIISLLS